MLEDIKKSIVQTLAFFALQQYALTLDELWQWLFYKQPLTTNQPLTTINRGDFLKALEILKQAGIIAEKDRYYFLNGQSDLIQTRLNRKEISLRKIDKANKLINLWLKHMPWIKAVFLSNSLSYLNAEENSDIDFLIVTARNKLWLARLLAVLPLKIFNLRPTAQNKKDKFCLSYFVAEDFLNLENYEACQEFPILVYWTIFIYPLFDRKNYWQKFCLANSWLKNFLPNFEFVCQDFAFEKKDVSQNIYMIKKTFGEKMAQKLQMGYLPNNLKKLINLDSRVIIQDGVIKLHGQGQRQEFYEKWQSLCAQYLK